MGRNLNLRITSSSRCGQGKVDLPPHHCLQYGQYIKPQYWHTLVQGLDWRLLDFRRLIYYGSPINIY